MSTDDQGPQARTRLAEHLRSATKTHHARAERAGIMGSMLRGTLERSRYGAFLLNLRAIYDALERELDARATHPLLQPVWLSGLRRTGALDDDLKAFDTPSRSLAPETQAYVARVAALGATAPHRLVAHAYVRYLGDLSGGQMIAKIVERAYECADGRGVRFYDFGGPDASRSMATAFREGLDRLPLSGTQRDEVVAEAGDAFERHERLFVQLDAPG